MTNAVLRGKPYAGNPHVRFDEGEVASEKPRRGSLLYNTLASFSRRFAALLAVTGLTAMTSFGGLLDKAVERADKVEGAYSSIWNGFYGVGKMRNLLSARLDTRPDGTPNMIVDKANGAATFTIRLSVNDAAYNAWKADAHQRIDSVGMSYRFSEFEDPEARVIGGKAYRFGNNEEASIRRWEESGKGKKAEVVVRVETVDASGKWLRRWVVPLRSFKRLGYDSFPLPLAPDVANKDLNRLKDLPASVFKWVKEGLDMESGVEDSYATVSVKGMSENEMAAIEDVRCTVIDDEILISERAAAMKASLGSLPASMVAIPGKNYKMCKYEVTQALWEAVMENNPSKFKGADRPVERVSWDDCQEFIEKLNKMTGGSYRLPTEEEWEYACRAGSTGKYGLLADGTEGKLDEMGWYSDNSGYETHPVGRKKPNAFGLYDMHGNVWEWTSTPVGERRVFRGGSWGYDAGRCESDDRGRNNPDLRGSSLGLRLASASAGL